MRFIVGSRVAAMSRQTAVTLLFVAGLLVAFGYATYLSYYGSIGIRNAFAYQSEVVSAQRDSEVLQGLQLDLRASTSDLRQQRKLLFSDLERIDRDAATPEQRAPAFRLPAGQKDFERLVNELKARQVLGEERFDATVRRNTQTRDISNAMFALVALLFTVIVGRLRSRLEEGRSLVARLQRAFISRRRPIENVDIGSVLISATRGSNVGGDTHDAFTLDRRYAMFLVADVSGKGIDAAVDTALIKYSVRTLFSEERDPGIVLSKFARLYAASAEKPETFVVMFLAVLDLVDGTVRYASAGHEPAWVLLGQDVATLPPTGPIVNIELESAYETRTIHLTHGDALVVSTDGLTESRDSRGNLLGADAVSMWIGDLSGDAQTMADSIVKRLRRRSSSITDDLAILVVRYAPTVRPGAGGGAVARSPLAAIEK